MKKIRILILTMTVLLLLTACTPNGGAGQSETAHGSQAPAGVSDTLPAGETAADTPATQQPGQNSGVELPRDNF